MAESIDRELEALKADFATLNQTVADLARDVKALLSATVSEGEDKTRASVQETLQGLREKVGKAQDQGRRYVEGTEQRIGEHPFTSLLTAFGIGFIVAKLMDMGSRR
jgi:ElaB/YqjD/DUF883 family membrane-anchored ribosome-binding protein